MSTGKQIAILAALNAAADHRAKADTLRAIGRLAAAESEQRQAQAAMAAVERMRGQA